MLNFGEWSEDVSLELLPGFTDLSYSYSVGNFDVHFSIYENEEGIFHQWISNNELGICIDQKIDMREKTWERIVYYS